MTYKELITKLKQELKKETAAHILQKREYGQSTSTGTYIPLRYKHIAYCLLRGTPFDKIESKWRQPNNGTNIWCKSKAEALFKKYQEMIEVKDETVCSDS